MFGEEFYPTPMEVIEMMLAPYTSRYGSLRFQSILEPSAGKGDILDAIKKKYRFDGKLYAIEKNEDLSYILQGKKYRVIGKDIFAYSSELFFDFIIMNPPFSNADEHILKAWEILTSGHLVALCNLETLENPYSEKRKLLKKIIEDNGSYENIGRVFENAERGTNVEVALIRLEKKGINPLEVDFSCLSTGEEKINYELEEASIYNQLQMNDTIGNMMVNYEKVKETFAELMKCYQKLNYYSSGIVRRLEHKNTYLGIINIASELATQSVDKDTSKIGVFNTFVEVVKEGLWNKVFDDLKLEKYITHEFKSKFDSFQKVQSQLDFTKQNVFDLVSIILQNKDKFLEEAVVSVFDLFTRFHKENRVYIEGWKTNDVWKVNKRIILPQMIAYNGNTAYLKPFSVVYSKEKELNDIDKVMAYLSGSDYNDCVTIANALETAFSVRKNFNEDDNSCISTFFKIKFFKKGTIHLEFKDEFLFQEFNIRATKGKDWLPDYEYEAYQKQKGKNTQEQSPSHQQLKLIA